MPHTVPVSDGSIGTHLRTQLPTPIALGLESAVSPIGRPGERLSRRIAFVERLLRFCVAVQEPLRNHLQLPRPPAVGELLHRLHRPTLGLWGTAAAELAQTLGPRRDVPAAHAFGSTLFAHGSPSELHAGCTALIEIRNRVAHSAKLASLPDDEAEVWLQRSRAPLHQLIRGLEPLCAVELVVPTYEHQSLLGRTHLQLLRYRGVVPTPVHLEDAGARPPVDLPLLVCTDGSLVPLFPWFVHHRSAATGTLASLMAWGPTGPLVDALGMAPHAVPGVPHAIATLRPKKGLDKLALSAHAQWTLDPQALRMLDTPSPQATPPPQVRNLCIGDLLGRGGAGSVWAVVDPSRPQTPLALKVLHPRVARVPDAVTRLRREFDLLQQLATPGIVLVEELIEDRNAGPCLLMERVHGESLSTVLGRGPMPVNRACSLVLSVLRTLGHVHRHGVVHRDLKPSNIMVTESGTRLLDFGVARVIHAQPLTRTGDLIGTRNYAAPEQLNGQVATYAADLYAMGLVLADLVRGGRTEDHTIPPTIAPVVRRATSKRPTDRYASAQEMADALTAAQQNERHACALHPGEALSGGLRLNGSPVPVGDRLFILSATTRSGRPAAVLAPSSEGSSSVLLFRIRDQLSQEALHQWTRSRVQTTDDGVPWVELPTSQPEACAQNLLRALDDPHVHLPQTKMPPTPPRTPKAPKPKAARPPKTAPQTPSPPPPDPPRPEPSAPDPSERATDAPNQAASQLGILAAGVLAGAVMAKSPAARAAVARVPLTVSGLGPISGLVGLVAAAARRSKQSTTVAPASPNPKVNIQHRLLFLLALEESVQQATHIDEPSWRAAWEQPAGGLFGILQTAWTQPPVVRALLLRAPSWPVVAGILQRLQRGTALGTADVAPLAQAVDHTLRSLKVPQGRTERSTPWIQVVDGAPVVRRAVATQGWQGL